MLALEREIAYDVMRDIRAQCDILKQEFDEDLIEKSDITAMGVAVPEMLVTEEDEAVLMEADRKTP